MKKQYSVYWPREETGGHETCNRSFKEFDTITEALRYFHALGTKEKHLLKLVTWKTERTDITEQGKAEYYERSIRASKNES